MISPLRPLAQFPKQFLVAALWVLVTASSASGQTPNLPPFLADHYAPLFYHNGVPLKFLGNVTENGIDQYRYRDKGGYMTLILERVACKRQTCVTIFDNFISAINRDSHALETTFLNIKKPNAQAIVQKRDTISNVIVLRMPDSVNVFSFTQPLLKYQGFEKTKPMFAAAYAQVKSFADRQRYEQTVLMDDNVEMGSWSDSYRTHALALLASGKKEEALTALQRVAMTSPYDLEAHRFLMENSSPAPEARASAEVILRNAESPGLYAKAAAFLKQPVMTIESIPFIEKPDDTLQLILIPLGSIDLDLLSDAAKIYEKITSIPVKFRRLRDPWNPGKPDRPFAIFNGQIIEFSGLSNEQFVAKLYKTPNQTALNRYYFEDFRKKLGKSAGQFNASRLFGLFFNNIEGYVSVRPRTMIVGVTSANIFSGRARFVFNAFIRSPPSRAGSMFSYQMLKAFDNEPQSRERLAERIAKELVPASLQTLKIPRATDPRDPYSYSNGVERTDQKSLVLSPPTAEALAKFR